MQIGGAGCGPGWGFTLYHHTCVAPSQTWQCLHVDCIAVSCSLVLLQQALCRSVVQAAAQVGALHLMDSAAHAPGTSSIQEE